MSCYRAGYEGLSFPHLPAIFGRILRHHRVGSDDVYQRLQNIPEAATGLVGAGFIIVAFVIASALTAASAALNHRLNQYRLDPRRSESVGKS